MRSIRAALFAPLAAAAVAWTDAAAQSGSLEVKVTDEAGAPLSGVVASVDGVPRGRTGPDGQVKVGALAAGWHAVKLARVDRVALGLGVRLPAGAVAAVEVGLPPARLSAVALPPVRAFARKYGGFVGYQPAGEHVGPGRRWTGGDILRHKPGRLSDLLRDAPEVELLQGPSGPVLRFRRAFAALDGSPRPALPAPPDCAPTYYVDGVRFDGVETPDIVPPGEVEELLLYPGNVPAAYGGMRASCGVVVIRTRGGPSPENKPLARPGYHPPAPRKAVAPKAPHPAPKRPAVHP